MTIIEAFVAATPIRAWCHGRTPCAIYFGFSSFNGYVQLPQDSPLLTVAEAYDVLSRVERDPNFFLPEKYGSLGYDSLNDMLDATMRDLTYGPDLEGWVGFDTAHPQDVWDDTIIDQELTDAGASDQLERIDRLRELLGADWSMSGIWGNRRWTIDELMVETNALAEQLTLLDKVIRRIGAHHE
jgi:hypothetical protein